MTKRNEHEKGNSMMDNAKLARLKFAKLEAEITQKLLVTEKLLEVAKQCIKDTITSLDIALQPPQIYAFQAVDKDVFYNYIGAIKTVLKYEANEWHVVEQLVTHPNHAIYYHVARHDFSEGADHQPIEGLTQCVFAFIQQTDGADDLHFILNHPPFSLRLMN